MKIRIWKNDDVPYAYDANAGSWHITGSFVGKTSFHAGYFSHGIEDYHEVKNIRLIAFMDKATVDSFVHDCIFNMNPFGKKMDSAEYAVSRFPKNRMFAVAILNTEVAHGNLSKDSLKIENFGKWKPGREYEILGEVCDFDWERDVTYIDGVMHVAHPKAAAE